MRAGVLPIAVPERQQSRCTNGISLTTIAHSDHNTQKTKTNRSLTQLPGACISDAAPLQWEAVTKLEFDCCCITEILPVETGLKGPLIDSRR